MSDAALKQPTKSILKQNHGINSSGASWFSKFNNNNNNTTVENSNTTTTAPLPRINSLFGSFRKQQPLPVESSQHFQHNATQEDIALNAELVPKAIRRVRFPVTDMTTEFLFKKEDLITDRKKQTVIEPIHIQTSAQFLSLYESVCRKKQEPTLDVLVSVLIVNKKNKRMPLWWITNIILHRINLKLLF